MLYLQEDSDARLALVQQDPELQVAMDREESAEVSVGPRHPDHRVSDEVQQAQNPKGEKAQMESSSLPVPSSCCQIFLQLLRVTMAGDDHLPLNP